MDILLAVLVFNAVRRELAVDGIERNGALLVRPDGLRKFDPLLFLKALHLGEVVHLDQFAILKAIAARFDRVILIVMHDHAVVKTGIGKLDEVLHRSGRIHARESVCDRIILAVEGIGDGHLGIIGRRAAGKQSSRTRQNKGGGADGGNAIQEFLSHSNVSKCFLFILP